MPRLTKFLWVGCVLAAAFGAREAASAEKIVWDIAIYGPPREVTTQIEYVAKYIEEKSNGNFTFKLHYGESISPAKAMLDSLKIGAIHGAFATFTYVPGKTPLHLALDLPYLPVPDLDTWQKVQEKFYAWEPIKKELEKWNGVALYATLLPPYEFMGTGNAPKTLDDWKGMRVRALGPHGDAMRTLGAVPTSVPAPEVYTALERGTFQAASFPFSYSFGAYRLYEVSNWYTMGMQFAIVNSAWVFSKKDYDRLPAEYKKLLDEARPGQYEVVKKAYKEADKKYIPMFDKAGLERITFTPEMLAAFQEKAGRPVWDKWVKENEAKGLPAKETLDFVLKTIEEVTGKEATAKGG
ncbi:MAG: TRAP transporter substrate-binding protein DctP [Alphaproteobacteria bacterium]